MLSQRRTRPAGDPVDSDRPTQLRVLTSLRRETDGLIQVGFCLPSLNFDRFHQPRLFTVGAREPDSGTTKHKVQAE